MKRLTGMYKDKRKKRTGIKKITWDGYPGFFVAKIEEENLSDWFGSYIYIRDSEKTKVFHLGRFPKNVCKIENCSDYVDEFK